MECRRNRGAPVAGENTQGNPALGHGHPTHRTAEGSFLCQLSWGPLPLLLLSLTRPASLNLLCVLLWQAQDSAASTAQGISHVTAPGLETQGNGGVYKGREVMSLTRSRYDLSPKNS